jgi:hypothetical protein
MTLDRLGRWRLPVIAVVAVLLALAVTVGILLVGNAPGVLNGTPTPSASSSAVGSGVPGDTPESAVRAFFEAFAEARETDDPALIKPYVNGTESSAYLTVAAFLEGQAGQGKASVVTVNELINFDVDEHDDRAVVSFDHRLGGYDIDVDSGEPVETPVVLPTQRKMADLVWVDGRWLVDSFEDVP